ncbi:hypothetical protein [Enemella sp. A6]|uniref:hypothetical protein n=1 Tax=Enemella sp. A6 TaxID=3440152 RepID=UPI003EBA7111
MKMKKHYFATALAVGSLALAGCAGAGDDISGTPEDTTTSTNQETEQPAQTPATDAPESDAPQSDAPESEPADDSDGGQPAGDFTNDALPTAEDMEWQKPGDWEVKQGGEYDPMKETDTCQQKDFTELVENDDDAKAGAFTLKTGDAATDRARAVVMNFSDEESAEKAYEEIRGWSRDCTADAEGVPNQQNEVEVSEGEAEFSDWTRPDEGFTMVGVTHRENRVGWVVMEVNAQDNNWDYEEGGEVGQLHPMFRTLPKVNERIVK